MENILLSLSDDSVIDSCSYQRDLFWTTRPSVSVAKLNILHTFVPSQVSQEVKNRLHKIVNDSLSVKVSWLLPFVCKVSVMVSLFCFTLNRYNSFTFLFYLECI